MKKGINFLDLIFWHAFWYMIFYSDTSDKIDNFTFVVLTVIAPVFDLGNYVIPEKSSLEKAWRIYIQSCVGILRIYLIPRFGVMTPVCSFSGLERSPTVPRCPCIPCPTTWRRKNPRTARHPQYSCKTAATSCPDVSGSCSSFHFLTRSLATGAIRGQCPPIFCDPKFYCAQKNLFETYNESKNISP